MSNPHPSKIQISPQFTKFPLFPPLCSPLCPLRPLWFKICLHYLQAYKTSKNFETTKDAKDTKVNTKGERLI